MSTNDQVVCIEVGEAKNAVIKFVGDNIDLNVVSPFVETLRSTEWV